MGELMKKQGLFHTSLFASFLDWIYFFKPIPEKRNPTAFDLLLNAHKRVCGYTLKVVYVGTPIRFFRSPPYLHEGMYNDDAKSIKRVV